MSTTVDTLRLVSTSYSGNRTLSVDRAFQIQLVWRISSNRIFPVNYCQFLANMKWIFADLQKSLPSSPPSSSSTDINVTDFDETPAISVSTPRKEDNHPERNALLDWSLRISPREIYQDMHGHPCSLTTRAVLSQESGTLRKKCRPSGEFTSLITFTFISRYTSSKCVEEVLSLVNRDNVGIWWIPKILRGVDSSKVTFMGFSEWLFLPLCGKSFKSSLGLNRVKTNVFVPLENVVLKRFWTCHCILKL